MTPTYLLDTNICIYIAKQQPPGVLRRFTGLITDEIGMSLITYGELRYGASKSQAWEKVLKKLESLQRHIPVLPLFPAVADHYGDIRATLERQGIPIGNNDLWIAAHARALGVTLVSNNLREFQRVENLALENWADS